MKKVVCNKCKYEFNITLRKEKLKIRNNAERVYFVCPKCKEEYTSYYSNDEIKDKQNQIRAMQEEYLKLRGKSFKKAFKLQKEINKFEEEIGVDMDNLRKKPVVVEAFKWTGDINQKEDPAWIHQAIKDGLVWFNNKGTEDVNMEIKTLEGNHIANRGDYIIKGIAGELYPCKPDIFTATYEKVD